MSLFSHACCLLSEQYTLRLFESQQQGRGRGTFFGQTAGWTSLSLGTKGSFQWAEDTEEAAAAEDEKAKVTAEAARAEQHVWFESNWSHKQ